LQAAVCGAVFAQAPASAFIIQPQPLTAADLAARFTPAQIEILEKLNRRDSAHLVRADPPVPGLIVPAVWDDGALAFSPFPAEWAAAADYAKVIVVDQPVQAFAAYERGQLVRWGPVSTGRAQTPTPSGLFYLTWRARSRRSTDNAAWLLEWYFNFVNERGVSFHKFDLPGYPGSHACVRLRERDAQWVYEWGEQWTLDATRRLVVTTGTPVLILGTYAYKSPAPWLDLTVAAGSVQLPDVLPPPASPGRR
jgi:lipoprotein-anchoring transpeptidase ErfK/SrfK